MSNGAVTYPISISLADFLATPVSDGTWNDVIVTPKIDDPTLGPVPATGISERGGELYANTIDSMFLVSYQAQYKAAKIWQVADAVARDALGSDDGLAVNDLLFQIDTQTLWYCTAVLGGALSTWAPTAATGTVVGPLVAIDNEVAVFDGVSGALIKGGTGVLIAPTGNISGVANLTLTGTVDGRDVALDGVNQDAHIASVANPHITSLAQALAAGDQTNGNAIEFTAGDPLTFNENAAVPGGAPGAGQGKVWVRNDVPNTLIFTDDAGVDHDVGAGTTDVNAVHVNVANELSIIANKAVPAGADFLLIEDSAAAGVKKHILISALPTGGAGSDTTAIHDNVANEISAVANKAVPAAGDYILIEDSAAAGVKKHVLVGALPAGGPGSDTDAIHDNVAGEIAAIANKATPAAGDYLIIEDSAAANVKKHILVSSLPTGGAGSDSTAIHDNVAAEISAVALKATPVSGDYLLIEDSAAGDAKKRITLGTIPGTSAETLAATLVAGNTTGGTNLIITNGDKIGGSAGVGAVGGTASIIGGTGAATFAGGPVDVTGGSAGAGAGAGGAITITGGTPGATGVGGAVSVNGGTGGATSGAGGAVSLNAGDATAGNSSGGLAQISGGNSTGSGGGGYLFLLAGSAAGSSTGVGGKIEMTAGDGGAISGAGGAIDIWAGDATTSGAGGAISIISGAGKGGAGGGALTLTAGPASSTGSGGDVGINGGDASGAVSGDGGDIILTPGSAVAGSPGQTTINGLKTSTNRIQHDLGNAVVAGDFTLTAGWGATATVTGVAGTDSRCVLTITPVGAGMGANPTVTWTYGDGAWPNAPFPMANVLMVNGGGAYSVPPFDLTTRSTTQAVWTYRGTPAAGDVFTLMIHVMG